MESDLPDNESIFIGLLEGIIPDRISGITPEVYAEMLIKSIRFHEGWMHEADEEISFCQEMLEWYNSFKDGESDEGEEPLADYLMGTDQMHYEIGFYKEQFLAVKAMMESCECELLRLLETHPGLKDKV